MQRIAVTKHHRHAAGSDTGLRSEQGPNSGEHAGRSANPIIKISDLAWLEFEKPDLARAETFARDFGFTVADKDDSAIHLRGSFPGTPCVVIRRGQRSRFAGATFRAADRSDLDRLARKTEHRVESVHGLVECEIVRLCDPSGFRVSVVYPSEELPGLPEQQPHKMNTGLKPERVNRAQRPPSEPARVQRLGHLVLGTPHLARTLDWYLGTLGMIVSDFQYLEGQREQGPTLAFIRCDRGSVPSDHHTLALHLGPVAEYGHSAYQVTDLDALAVGGEFLSHRGYQRAWGIGRHRLGSQIFDYWRDPDRLMVEHFTDGDMFDSSVEPGWGPMTASGLYQWGPRVGREFLGANVSPKLIRDVITALLRDNDITPSRLAGMAKGMNK
ncbi:2,3-dihydroxybiphenyl 1,2-dioxygenase [Mycobacterium sp. 1482292.6]|uniref:VOC family protein n=1 Tax=Mycobacterium sp. 1482292.6 TaxID=1834081 RepID=UPI0008017C17|nr:VOC family protein [Mycobacterium sp. 1482292.6]OBJ12638.1 2,3-dihydroxybiphenyl 1,2-dioxygenase [Mycobacterium sp. 1482292.6]